jgi:two-component sensor histidine kinase
VGGRRVHISGADVALSPGAVTGLALLLHEFATNAAKYGALSAPAGRIEVECHEEADRLVITWIERDGPRIDHPPAGEGFGSLLAQMTIRNQFGGDLLRDWRPEGLTVRLSILRDRLLG